MTGAGNDIVSIKAINITRTRQQKFYSKILSDTEIPLYNEFNLSGIPFEIFVWLLWSVKESAYKFLQRHNPALIFTPVRFITGNFSVPEDFEIVAFDRVAIESQGFSKFPAINGTVLHGDNRLYFRSIIRKQFLMSIVNDENNFDDIHWGVKSIEDCSQSDQSGQVRSFALDRLKALEGVYYRLEKTESGCPVLFNGNDEVQIPISFSHHEEFVGYSFHL